MSQTLFEKIIARQIPATFLYEDQNYVAFNDIDPKAPAHVLVVTKRVIPSLESATAADAPLIGGMFLVAKKVMNDLGFHDYRTVFNTGAGAQQSVFHLHLHVLAGRPMSWPPG